MITSNLITQVKSHEGLMLKPYKCTADKLTIGYGRNIEDIGITEEEADHLLENDLKRAFNELSEFWPNVRLIGNARRDALINMCFNLGISRLKKFKKMFAALNASDYERAAEEMIDSKWARQVGDRASELAEQMLTGKYKA